MQRLSTSRSIRRRACAGLLVLPLALAPTMARAAPETPPEAEPAPAPDSTSEQSMAGLDAPSPDAALKGPHVRLEVARGRGLSLYGVDSEFVGYGSGSGGSVAVHGMSFRRLCDAPCDRHVRSGTGTYFVGGGPYTASRRLQLPESGDVVVEARPGHKALYWTGWMSLVVGLPLLITGATLAGLKVGSRGLQGGLIGGGAVLVTASIPLFIFGRTRAKVRS